MRLESVHPLQDQNQTGHFGFDLQRGELSQASKYRRDMAVAVVAAADAAVVVVENYYFARFPL